MSKKDKTKKCDKKSADKVEKKSVDKIQKKRELLLETLDILSDFCMDNILALRPLMEDEDEIVAAKTEASIIKYGTMIEIFDTLADLADGKIES